MTVVGEPRLEQRIVQLGVELQAQRSDRSRKPVPRGRCGRFRPRPAARRTGRSATGTTGRREPGRGASVLTVASRSRGRATAAPSRRTPARSAARRSTRRAPRRLRRRRRAPAPSRRPPTSAAAVRRRRPTVRRGARPRRSPVDRETPPRTRVPRLDPSRPRRTCRCRIRVHRTRRPAWPWCDGVVDDEEDGGSHGEPLSRTPSLGWHGRGVVGGELGADPAEQHVGGVDVVAPSSNASGSIRDGDGDRHLLRRQVGRHAGFPREQRVLQQPAARDHDAHPVGVAVGHLGARGAAGLGPGLAAQVGRRHRVVRLLGQQLAGSDGRRRGLHVVDVGRLDGPVGDGPRWIPVRGLLVERCAAGIFERLAAFTGERVQHGARDLRGEGVGGVRQPERASTFSCNSFGMSSPVAFSSALPRRT